MLAIKNVSKRYESVVAVDTLSFEAEPGRIYGLLGPNGAGKTSTIRMISFITLPDSGVIELNGKTVGAWSQDIMGYLPEERGLYKRMKVGEQLLYLARLKGLTAADARRAIDKWLERFGALDWKKKKIDELSKGMQQKIQFVATVLHDPDLLIFDEPFSGLDPINTDLLKEVILELKDNNRIILFASHRMEQVEQMCDDICLMSDGRSILQGNIRDVKRSFGKDTVILDFDGESTFLKDLEAKGQIRVANLTNHHAEIRLLNGHSHQDILQQATQHFDSLYRFELVEPSLNEIFISVVEGVASGGTDG